jgi:hypothetical protein
VEAVVVREVVAVEAARQLAAARLAQPEVVRLAPVQPAALRAVGVAAAEEAPPHSTACPSSRARSAGSRRSTSTLANICG